MDKTKESALRRWSPCIAMMLLSLLSYVDRSALAVLSPTILADLKMTATQYGYAVLVFSLCYMLANPLWGLWIDRRGLFITILLAVGVWSVASAGHAVMLGFGTMCLARGLLGFGEGATFPAGLSAVAETLPPEHRAFGTGLAYSGSSLGAALTPLLITPIAMRHGWRWAFVLTGLLGAGWMAIWVLLRITRVYPPRAHSPERYQSLGTVRSRLNRNVFAAAAAYGLGAAPLAFGLYTAPLYLARVMHLSQASLGHLLWIPPAGWEAGYLFWGRFADRRKVRAQTRPARLFAAFAVCGFIITLVPFAAASSHPLALIMVVFFLQMFVAGGYVVLSLADGMSVQPRENAGFLAGVAISSWALVTGLLMPVLGHLFDARLYRATFWLIASLPPIGSALWWLLATPSRRLPKAAPVLL